MKRFLRLIAGACAIGLAAAASAQVDYPKQPLKLILPCGPGGATDNVARQLSVKLSEELGTSVVIENRPGAAGNIALDAVARANPDGYTMLLGNVSTNAINQWIYSSQMKSNPLKDLVPVSMVATVPGVFVSSAKFAPNSLAELVAYAKSRPGEVNHASAGAGAYAMIDMLAFERSAGIKMVHVPFKGGAGQYVVSMVSNDVQVSLTNASTVLELVRAGKLKALAVTGDRRLNEFPGVPTMAEAGFKGVGTSGWQGVFAPTGTPQPIIDKVHAAISKALARPDLRENYAKMMIEASGSASPQEFAQFVRQDADNWRKLVEEFKITVE